MKRLITFHLVLIGCLLLNGCSGVHNSLRPSAKSTHWNMFNRNTAESKESKKKKDALPPENMVVIWKDAVLEKPGAPSVRGFGARIYFHDSENQAIKAEGELVVYGFDDSSAESGLSRQPTKKFVFTNDQFQTHHSESNLGASYSVWIPWEKVGGERKTISLVAVFKTADGKVINGGSSNNVLPGKPPEDTGTEIVAGNRKPPAAKTPIVQAGYTTGKPDGDQTTQAVMNEDLSNAATNKSTTINLTPSMASLLSTPAAQPVITGRGAPSNVKTFQPGDNVAMTSPNESVAPASKAKSKQPVTAENSEKTNLEPKKQAVFGVPGSFR